MEGDFRKVLELVSLMEHVQCLSPMFDACDDYQTLTVRKLRLVNKDASRVALLGLRVYTLRLEGGAKDTNVSGASLLQHTSLRSLAVHLHLTESHSPALLLRVFLREVGSALMQVTSLAIHLLDTCNSAFNTALLHEVIVQLIAACPLLTSFTVGGRSTLATLCTLVQARPLLSSLTIASKHASMLEIQELVDQVPFLLPNVHTLSISDTLPDLSKNVGITTLCMEDFTFGSESENGPEAEWLCLPPHLQHLQCFSVHVGPAARTTRTENSPSRHVLGDLLSLEVYCCDPSLWVVADILRAAPALQSYRNWFGGQRPLTIDCYMQASAAADLSVLLQRSPGVDGLRGATYKFDAENVWVEGPELLPLIAALPRMTAVSRCKFFSFPNECLGPYLGMFPDIQTLYLLESSSVDDIALHELPACKHLVRLELVSCKGITPEGLHALCMHLPLLRSVSIRKCELTGPSLSRCVELLQALGVVAEVLGVRLVDKSLLEEMEV